MSLEAKETIGEDKLWCGKTMVKRNLDEETLWRGLFSVFNDLLYSWPPAGKDHEYYENECSQDNEHSYKFSKIWGERKYSGGAEDIRSKS